MLPLTQPNMSFTNGVDHENGDDVESPNNENDESGDNTHDQLPSVEEIRMSVRSSCAAAAAAKRKGWFGLGRCGEIGVITLVAILIVTVIGLSVGVAKRGDEVDAANNGGATTTTGSDASREPREVLVRQWLDANGVSSRTDMMTAGSAHKFAVLWLADEDELFLPIPESIDSPEGVRFVSRYVSALVYFSMGGDAWDYQLSFLSEKDVCEWNDIFVAAQGVQGRFFRIGMACQNGIINTWQMPGMNLAGTIPEEITFLSNLRVIALNSNKIGGTLPQGFQTMTGIDYVALQQNSFVGTLPEWIGDLQLMRVLGLGDNDFEGSIPASLGTMTDLITLGLDNNKLSGEISFLEPLTRLRRVYLEGNDFDASLNNVFANMAELEELDISSNRFKGNIPTQLLTMSTLRVLDMHANQFDGSIPNDIPFNAAMNYLALHENLLTGTIPSSIAYMFNLTHLDLSSNVFGGEIPTRLGELTHLKYLFLASNSFTPGPIPTWIGNLTKLEDFSLRETGRFNDMPSQFGMLKNLTLLDLDNNDLTGPLPRQLGELPNLRFLILSRNEMTGTVPADFELLTTLEMLMLNDNSFTGSVDGICSKGIVPSVFVADCVGEVTCSCCTECCEDTDEACSEMEPVKNLDPVWKNSFEREFYEFGSELIFDGRL